MRNYLGASYHVSLLSHCSQLYNTYSAHYSKVSRSCCFSVLSIVIMSSMRRLLSFECSETTAQTLPTEASRIVRHSSLPNIVCHPESIRFRPYPTRLLKTSHGTSSSSNPNPASTAKPALCRAMSDNFDESRHRDFMSSGCFVPDWCTEGEPNACTERAFVRSMSRKDSKVGLDVENSVVYKDLSESIWRFEAPAGFYKSVGASISKGAESAINHEVKPGARKMNKNLDTCRSDARGRPMSLRMLKRKLSKVKPEASDCQQHMRTNNLRSNQFDLQHNNGIRERLLSDVGDSVASAFGSLVFMMKMLHQHTMCLRAILMNESDNSLQDVLGKVHAEMQDSFLWLFQQVFSRTPKLMLLTMMLLADFTVHSMSKHVALAVMPMGEPPTASVVPIESASRRAVVQGLSLRDRCAGNSLRISLCEGFPIAKEPLYEPSRSEGGEGNGGVRNVKVGGGMDGQAMPNTVAEGRAITVEDDTRGGVNDASLIGCSTVICNEDCSNHMKGCSNHVKSAGGSCVDKEDRMLSLMREALSKELDSRPVNNIANLVLDRKTKHMLVAPVRAPELEADDYSCYDRTDLNYQHEISMDPGNPLLLANYAQFVYLVRHDHGRAEELFKRAMRADPGDGEVMGRFASFLWVAKGDVEEADRAYKAAVAADPTNSFQAGCYAHFLWNSSAGQEDTPMCSPHQQVATS